MNAHQLIIARAQSAGSVATTVAGASRYLLCMARAAVPWKQPKPPAFLRRETKAQYQVKNHQRRLIARFIGWRFIRKGWLTDADLSFISRHPDRCLLLELRACPLYARAVFPHAPLQQYDSLKAELRQWERAKGRLEASNLLAADAYDRAPWGRLRKTFQGKCGLRAGISTTDNGKSGWDKVVWHKADYTHIIPPEPHAAIWESYYVSADQSVHRVLHTSSFIEIDDRPAVRIASPQAAPVVRTHHQRRLLAPEVPDILTLGYDRKAQTFTLTDGFGEIYHLDKIIIRSRKQAAKQVRKAIAGLRRRRAQKFSLPADLTRCYVSLTDSVESGNCESQSQSFARQAWAAIGATGETAVRADVVLSLRNDEYTRRAVAFAAAR